MLAGPIHDLRWIQVRMMGGGRRAREPKLVRRLGVWSWELRALMLMHETTRPRPSAWRPLIRR